MSEKYLTPDYSPDDDDIEDDFDFTNEGKQDQEQDNTAMRTYNPFDPNDTGINTPPRSNWPSTSFNPPKPSTSPWAGLDSSTSRWASQQNPSYSPFGNTTPPYQNQVTGEKVQLDRKKKVVFCDVLDCLVETYQSEGRPGLVPRGIYDMKPKFEVWKKIGEIRPSRIYALIPRDLIPSTSGADSVGALLEYIALSVAEYLRLPFSHVQVVTQSVLGQPKLEIVQSMLSSSNLKVAECLMIGTESGEPGQSDVDIQTAKACGMDYVDLRRLLTLYF